MFAAAVSYCQQGHHLPPITVARPSYSMNQIELSRSARSRICKSAAVRQHCNGVRTLVYFLPRLYKKNVVRLVAWWRNEIELYVTYLASVHNLRQP